MPRFQKLYEKFKDRPDVLLLTLNSDANPGLAESFMREHKLQFPVVPAVSYIQDTLGVFGIPDNWIVDADGVVRLKEIRYNPSEKWEEWMADLIEKHRVTASSPQKSN